MSSSLTLAFLSLDVVWPDTKQSGLIDSILRNYYIPPVIFGVFHLPRIDVIEYSASVINSRHSQGRRIRITYLYRWEAEINIHREVSLRASIIFSCICYMNAGNEWHTLSSWRPTKWDD